MLVRPRETPDEAACVDLLTRVHTHDGYPRHLPGWPAAFLFAGHETTAWVCEIDGQITGHVALHAAASDPALELAQRAAGLPANGLAVVARLLVCPGHRRQGIGRALLDLATCHARDNGQRAVLDVVTDTAGAPAAALTSEPVGRSQATPPSASATEPASPSRSGSHPGPDHCGRKGVLLLTGPDV